MDRSMKVGMISLIFLFLFALGDSIEATIEVNKTHYKDLYDCVDFYKQPAFDHPLLANHTFHRAMMRPSNMKIFETKVSNNNIQVQFKGEGCPIGTVPIRRITTNDFVKYGSKDNAANPGIYHAIVRTRKHLGSKYNGASAGFSIWNPSVEKSQYSSSQLVIRNGDDNIQVGWTVNPTLYGDTRTHLFIYTGAGSTQCFDTDCPGFVMTSKDIVLGSAVELVSKSGGPIYLLQIVIEKDENGNWWLRLGPKYDPVGFWPKHIFTNLAETATSVIWGGQVYSPPNVPSPPMGSGAFLKESTNYDAFCNMLLIVNEAHQVVDKIDIEAFSDNSGYQVEYVENAGESLGNIVLFGGPGGIIGN